MTAISAVADKKISKPYTVGPPIYKGMDVAELEKFVPKTEFGKALKAVAAQTNIYLVEMTAIAGYVNGLLDASLPNINFTDVPSGVSSSVAQLQSGFNSFKTQFQNFQKAAKIWNDSSGSNLSIITQLTYVTKGIGTMATSVEGFLSTLKDLGKYDKGSSIYKMIKKDAMTDLSAQVRSIQGLVTSLKDLSTSLSNAATAVVNASKTGVLHQLVGAYQQDVAKVQQAIDQANQAISAKNKRISALKTARDAAIALTAVGAVNFWNPFGWASISVGAKASHVAIEELNTVRGEVASLTQKVDTDGNWKSRNQSAALLVAASCHQLEQFTAMNDAAQAELTKLEGLFEALLLGVEMTDVALFFDDLSLTKWILDQTISLDGGLRGLTAYIWPPPRKLSFPKSFAAVGDDIYAVTVSGAMYHYSKTGNSWSALGQTGLSCVSGFDLTGNPDAILVIDGAPLEASSKNTTNSSTYHVKRFSFSNQAWTTLSDFPVSGITSGHGTVCVINQTDGKIYWKSVPKGNWNSLPALPGNDIASQIVGAGNEFYALANNSQLVYRYHFQDKTWITVAGFTCHQIGANGDYLSIIGTDNYCYVHNLADTPKLRNRLNGVAQVAQLTTGDQYRIGMDNSLAAYHRNPHPVWTHLQSNAVGVFASNTDKVYYASETGDLYILGANNSQTKLPALPKS